MSFSDRTEACKHQTFSLAKKGCPLGKHLPSSVPPAVKTPARSEADSMGSRGGLLPCSAPLFVEHDCFNYT